MDRSELADFLRTRRHRVQPADVGLPTGPRRRTPGLRREEIAQLAGMSVDYYVRLEQGRGPRPSPQILQALARALRLSNDERDHLYHLAGTAPGPGGMPRQDVPPGILHLLDRLDDAPAMVLDAKWDILAWNPMMAALVGDLSRLPEGEHNARAGERNALAWLFDGDKRPDDPDLVRYGRTAVADLRAAAARYPDDAGIAKLVSRLSSRSRWFAGLWDEHQVEIRRSTTKRVHHPVVGMLEMDIDTLHIPDRDQRLVIYTAAPGTASHEALQLLKVVGMQSLPR